MATAEVLMSVGLPAEAAKLLANPYTAVGNLSDLLTAISRGENVLLYRSVTLTANLTITNGLTIAKGSTISTNGFTLNINGPFEAGLYQVFNSTKNKVLFGARSVHMVYPEWWGALGDGSTNDTDPLRCAIGSFLKVSLRPNATYLCNATASSGDFLLYLGTNDGTSSRSGMEFFGCGNGTVLKLANSVGRDRVLFGIGNGETISNVTIRDLKIDLNGSNNLQTDFADPLRLNSAMYFYGACTNFRAENLLVTNSSGSQVFRFGDDTSGGVSNNVKIRNCVFDTFGIGLSSNLQQDVSVLYLHAENSSVEECTFKNADFTFSLSRGHTAIEMHCKHNNRIVNNVFEYVQLPWLLGGIEQDAYNVLIEGNQYKQCNYHGSFDSADDNILSRVTISNEQFASTKSSSVILPIGASSESAKTRSQIKLSSVTIDLTGNTNQRTHYIRVENSYLTSIELDNVSMKSGKGCLIYLAGPALPNNTGTIKINGGTLDSLGPDDGGTFPGDPCMVLISPTSNTLQSFEMKGVTFLNVEAKSYTGLGIYRRDGAISHLHVGDNSYQMTSSSYVRHTGTLSGAVTRYEEYFGSTTWDPASIADGASEYKDITVTGAAVGDKVILGFTTVMNNGMELTGQVTSANTVRARIKNNTGGAVDLASGTVSAIVIAQVQ